eukprot:5248076-Amphidinium_carterae.1
MSSQSSSPVKANPGTPVNTPAELPDGPGVVRDSLDDSPRAPKPASDRSEIAQTFHSPAREVQEMTIATDWQISPKNYGDYRRMVQSVLGSLVPICFSDGSCWGHVPYQGNLSLMMGHDGEVGVFRVQEHRIYYLDLSPADYPLDIDAEDPAKYFSEVLQASQVHLRFLYREGTSQMTRDMQNAQGFLGKTVQVG